MHVFILFFPISQDWKRDFGTSLTARPCNGRKLHDFETNLTSIYFLRRYISHAWGTRDDIILKRATLCTCWEFPGSKDQKRDFCTSLNARRSNGGKLHDIDNNLTSKHFSRYYIFHAWVDRRDILKRAKICSCLEFFKIPRLKARLWHIAKREKMQWKTTTWYRQQSHSHALFT